MGEIKACRIRKCQLKEEINIVFLYEIYLSSNEFKREMIRESLNNCTEKQIDLFNRMYGSIEVIKEAQMRHAYNQCRRTLEKNKNV